MLQIKALLIDLDGVIRRWPSSSVDLESSHGLPEGSIGATAFERELLHQAITGRVRDEVWRAKIADSLQEKYPNSRAQEAVQRWSSPVGEVDREVFNLIKKVSEKVKIILVTNATSKLENDLEALGLRHLFNDVVNSSDVGIAKPHPDIFKFALRVAKSSKNEVLFVDDTEANVNAATELGIFSHHFKKVEDLTNFLVRHEIVF